MHRPASSRARAALAAIPRSATGRRAETSHGAAGVSVKTRPRLGGCRGPPLAACGPPSSSAESRPAPAVSCYAGPTGLTGPLLSAAPRRVGPRLEPQVPAGEWAAAAGPAPKGPRMGPHCTGPQCLPSHPSYLLPTPVCSRNGAQAIRPSFSPLRIPSCCRASSPGTLS